MSHTKPGPVPKSDALRPGSLISLNLSRDIIILDGRHIQSTSRPNEDSITRLGGQPKKKKVQADLVPRWGGIDPATEDPDEIVLLFQKWSEHQQQASTLRIEKLVRKSYPREYKLKAVTLGRVGVVMRKQRKGLPPGPPEWERISQNHTATLLHINTKQLREWERDEAKIIQSLKGSRQVSRVGQPKWPEMEVQLHLQFKLAREGGRSVNRKWFERVGKQVFADLYPEQVGFDGDDRVVFDCFFSDGWFLSFKHRWGITWRCKTNVASKTPEDHRPKIILFCKFNRRNSQLRAGEEQCDVGRYPLGNMFNMDQTPFPFEFLTGRTYDFKGNKTIWQRALRASWGKRQATLQISICADGKKRCRPLMIFRGKGTTKAIKHEMTLYDPRVRALFNTKGYCNEQITLQWIETDFIPSCADATKPRFLALDVFAGQKTAPVLTAFRNSKIVTSFIPEGCTGLVQPLDTAVNKTLKAKISELLDEEMDKNPQLWESGRFTIGDRRVLMTWIVGDAWDWLHKEKSNLIINSFRHVGITLAVDGSEDSEIRIKGLRDVEVGDWREGGLDCNLNRMGKTGVGELEWDKVGAELLDPQVAIEAEKELAALENINLRDEDDGEYVNIDDLEELLN